jgi:transglutaminase-like putative cysteine protease
VALVGLLLLASCPSSPRRLARITSAALVTGLAVLAAAMLGPTAPGRDPADLRALVAAPVQPRSGVSPLQQYLALRDGIQLLRVTGTASRTGTALRMATMTAFDGTYWTVRGDFRRAATTLPPGGTIGGTDVTVNVDVAAGELDWLLSAGRPVRTNAAGMGVDEATGDVAVPAGNTPPRSYTVTSVLSDSNRDAVLAAEPAPSPGPLIPPLPPRIASWAASATAGAPTGSDQLRALYQRLVESGEFQYDQAQEVDGGHGYYQIQRLLENRRGTSEQYASAYAVIARHLGFNARVVMGFRPQYKDEAFTLTGRDVDAWVEVQFTGLGWVSIDPSPRANPIGTRPDAPPPGGKGTGGNDSFTNPGGSNDPPPTAVRHEDDGSATTDNDTSTASHTALLTLLGIAALATLAGIAPTAKYLRRIRRRRGKSTRLTVLGAWWETVDRLREVGLRAGPGRTTGEVVQMAGEAVELRALARIVDQAVYAPDDPPQGLTHEAWDAATEAQRQLRASLRPARRIAAWIDPRPLLRPRI